LTIYRQGEANIFISIISGLIYWHIEYSLGIGDARGTQKICKTSFVQVCIAYSANILAQGSPLKLFQLSKEIKKDVDEI
jgi:hypothetical protein